MGRMYGCSNPVRPCASCTVATPCSPSAFTTARSARSILRTATLLIIPDLLALGKRPAHILATEHYITSRRGRDRQRPADRNQSRRHDGGARGPVLRDAARRS